MVKAGGWVGREIGIVIEARRRSLGWWPGNGVYGWKLLICFVFLYIVVRWKNCQRLEK